MKRGKFISILTGLCLVVSMLPATAFADEFAPEAPTQAAAAVESTAAETSTDAPAAQQPSAPVQAPSDAAKEAQTLQTENPQLSQDPQQDPSSGSDPSQEPGAKDEAPQQTASETPDSQSPEEKTPVSQKETLSSSDPSQSEEKAAAQTATAPLKVAAAAEKTVSGIKVTGGVEGKDWIYDPEEQALTITKDGVTVSGTATDDLIILCTMAVSAITIDNLDQGKHLVALLSGIDILENQDVEKTVGDLLAGKTPCSLKLTVKGKNQIALVMGVGDVTISGAKNSSLTLSASGGAVAMFGSLNISGAAVKTPLLSASNDVSIRDSAVRTSLITAGRDINISGKSKVKIAPTKETKPLLQEGLFPALAVAGRNINIDLAPGGVVTAQGMKVTSTDALFSDVYPMMAMGRINISEGSKVVTPNGAHVETVDLYGEKVQVLMDGYSDQTAAAKTSPSGSSSGSPQTGDDCMNGLLLLYGLLILSGAAAFISRKAAGSR